MVRNQDLRRVTLKGEKVSPISLAAPMRLGKNKRRGLNVGKDPFPWESKGGKLKDRKAIDPILP